MPPPDPLPRYLYKIILSPPPDPFPAEYPPSDLEQQSGFFHFGTAAQMPTTAGLLFADTTHLWILKVRLATLADDTRWEEDGGKSYPHLYGRTFGAAELEDWREFGRVGDQSWENVIGGSDWLE